jgi:hypothetical protein
VLSALFRCFTETVPTKPQHWFGEIAVGLKNRCGNSLRKRAVPTRVSENWTGELERGRIVGNENTRVKIV